MSLLGKENTDPHDPYTDELPVADLIYSFDWSKTPLGAMSTWEPTLKTIVDVCVNLNFPIGIYYGPELRLIYNQMWRPILKMKHPALGLPAKEVWSEIYDVIGPMFDTVISTAKGNFQDDTLLLMHREGYVEECYFSFTFSPLFKSDGTVGGIFNAVQETTKRVLAARRLKTLGDLGNRTTGARSVDSACHLVLSALRENVADLPFALIYYLETNNKKKNANLIATTFDENLATMEGEDGNEELFFNGQSKRNLPDYLLETPDIVEIHGDHANVRSKKEIMDSECIITHTWPLQEVATKNSHVIVKLKDGSKAILLPVNTSFSGKTDVTAILICGLNARRKLDNDYSEFLHLVVGHVSSGLSHGRSREEERKQAEILADLNRQKIMFFQNISHELRTPLTLMLSPLDDVISNISDHSQSLTHLQMIRRNARRLLKLVNTLLQFSRTETSNLEAQFRETEIAKFTSELASSFESMAKSLDVTFTIDVPDQVELDRQLTKKVFIDRDMYEKILFNLCSNAFKHTWSGGVTVKLYSDNKDGKEFIVLQVTDTGVGIPENHISKLFQRFYRVESRQSRSHEGTGIGLALVQELIQRHGGDIFVESVVDQGSTFKVWIPTGWEHLPPKKVYFGEELFENVRDKQLFSSRELYIEEAEQWIQRSQTDDIDGIDQRSDQGMDLDDSIESSTLEIDIPGTETREIPSSWDDPFTASGKKFKILIVDDNTDMRKYLSGVLRNDFEICCACDGRDALKILRKIDVAPDLVLSDIMMPNMNGIDLLRTLRNNRSTQMIPIILLSAKAGEEASIEGLDFGADDYLTKPFSAKELIARIRVNIKLYYLRQQLYLEQKRQAETRQLLFSISSKIRSELNIHDILSTATEEVHKILSCDRIYIAVADQKDSANSKILTFSTKDPKEPNLKGQKIRFSMDEKDKYFIPLASGDLGQSNFDSHNAIQFIRQTIENPDETAKEFEVSVFPDYHSPVVNRHVSSIVLPIKVKVNSKVWGWIIADRPQNDSWFDNEKIFLQQMSNQISLAITHATLLEDNLKKDALMEAAKAANEAKGQILANTSHELRTPLGAIIGVLSAFEETQLSEEQKDMVHIMTRASDVVLSVVNDILDAAKLEAQKITLINRTFDLFDLMEKTIEIFGEKAGTKQVELILCCEPTSLPKYVKSDPESIKFTEEGEICLKVSMTNTNEIALDETGASKEFTKVKKGTLFVEIIDTGIGIDPSFIKDIWESFSQGDASMTRRQDGTGLGLSICKHLVMINGGEMGVQSDFGNGSRFWFTWIVEALPLSAIPITSISQFSSAEISMNDEKTGLILPSIIRSKRVLIIDPITTARNALVKLIGASVERIDAFDTSDKGITLAKEWRGTHNEPLYDIVFFNVRENNKEEIKKAAKELRICGKEDLCVALMVSSSVKGRALGQELMRDIEGSITTLCKPIMQKRLLDCLHNDEIFKSSISSAPEPIHDYNSVKSLADIRVEKYYRHKRPLPEIPKVLEKSPVVNNQMIVDETQEQSSLEGFKKTSYSNTKKTSLKRMAHAEDHIQSIDEYPASKYRSRPISNSKCILCVEDNPINLKVIQHQLSKLGYQTIAATNGQEAVNLIQAESGHSGRISLILMDCAMPVMSGFDASKAIRAIPSTISRIPIIALTASAVQGTRDKCIEAGMNDYLTKPLKIGQLKEMLAQWLGED
ncbi:11427_t:CDS:10 [Funneliformis geosporum]|uniref:histidine kinase n=1 Tax=Funneliformis geosporum TaxID=1117311 RepID=A0A9W4SK62_9GLOM|nr:11427_t:CDS:10 [Funneliformis geosporum]CAI2172488.1 1189_t:CDS:10 [Funneliformis geosporum]